MRPLLARLDGAIGVRLRRAVRVMVLLIATAASLLLPASAQAQTVVSGSFAITSDPGDYIGQGLSYSYSTDAGDQLAVNASTDDNHIGVAVGGANGDFWSLDLAAPAGQPLAAGVYSGATRYPFNAPGEPGLDVDGNGRGCNTLTGSFTIVDVAFAPNGYVQTLDATFEQHCDGADPALRGEVHIANPPPPPALELGLVVAVDGTASTLNGSATVHGTVSCNVAVDVSVEGTITQVAKRTLIRAGFGTGVSCTPGASVPWQATAIPGSTPFQKGDAEVQAQASAYDPAYDTTVFTTDTAVVRLKKS